MKTSSILLAGSVAANVVLLGAVLLGLSNQRASPGTNSGSAVPARSVAPLEATNAAGWADVSAEDPKQQAEKLQAEGFPPSMVRAIIGAQIRAKFAARRKALELAQGEQPFWRQATPDVSMQAALRALMKEEQNAIRAVLGPDPVNSYQASLRRQFPGFAGDTIEQIAALRERYDDQRMELYSAFRGGGSILPDEQAKMDALEKAMHAELAGLLQPQELEEYDLRTSNVANQLRYELVAFNASEQEFRELYRLKTAFDAQWGSYRGGASEAQMRARGEAQNQLNEQIKASLGAERYAEYQRATDYNYRQTTQLMSRLNLPPETANTLYTLQKEIEQRRNDLYRSSGGPPGTPGYESMVERAKALQQEALTRLTPILGSAQHVDAYKQYGGSWIVNLVPRPPPPRPKS